MPLEATLLILDNSDYAVNSDYAPTRWEVSECLLAASFDGGSQC